MRGSSTVETLFVAGLVVSSIVAVSAAGKANAQQADPVRISIYQPRGLGCAAILMGEQNGYFEEERIRFEPTYVQSGPQVAQLMAAGDLDIGCGAMTVWMIAKSKGVDLKVVYSTAKGNAPLLVKPHITSIKQLDGKGCGTPGLGTIHDDNLKAFAGKHGITLKHVYGSGMSNVVAMFDKGEIECMTGWEPLLAAASVRGDAQYLVDFMRPDSMESVEYAVMREFAQERPEVAYRFVRALLKGTRYIEIKPDDAITILSKATGFEKEVVVRALKRTIVTKPYIDLEGSQVALQDAIRGGKISANAVGDAGEFVRGMVDHSFLDKAAKALEEEEWKP